MRCCVGVSECFFVCVCGGGGADTSKTSNSGKNKDQKFKWSVTGSDVRSDQKSGRTAHPVKNTEEMS